MTYLSLAVRNTLAQYPSITALLGSDAVWDTWIQDERPQGIAIEATGKSMIVVNEVTQYTSPNEHNTMEFPQLLVDIWSDSTRRPDGNVRFFDAKRKIEDIAKQVKAVLHTVDRGTPGGGIIVWGTAQQIADKTGVVISGSTWAGGPDYSEVRDSTGAWMGRLIFDVNRV